MDKMIGSRIKNRRKELKLTGAQIKEQTGISTGNLSEIENGKILPSSAALIQLSKILKCSTDYILFGSSLISEISPLSHLSDDESRLLDFFRAINLDDQNELLVLAEMKFNRIQKTKDDMGKSSLLEKKITTTESVIA